MDDEEIITEERVSLTDHALRRLSVEEFLVDFLGGLIPGVLFFAAAAVVVFPVMHAVLRQEGRTNHPDLEGAALATIAATKDTPNALWFAILIVALLVSYVVGHLFYRRPGPSQLPMAGAKAPISKNRLGGSAGQEMAMASLLSLETRSEGSPSRGVGLRKLGGMPVSLSSL
jgi:hypothetical protein